MSLKKMKIKMVVKGCVTENIEVGINFLIHAGGLGGLEHNTVMIKWPNQWILLEDRRDKFIQILRQSFNCGHHICVMKPDEAFNDNDQKTGFIDIRSFVYEKGLKEMFSYFLSKSQHWKKCKQRLFIATTITHQNDELIKKIKTFLRRFRILQGAEIKIINISPEELEQYTYYEQTKPEIQQKPQYLHFSEDKRGY
eukprot:TRINITY_DN2878_c0_g2_i1.p1 TRINITY_DN2878_c0_g2~~TRINITY_DN2878_c0_g2_i1.p1  ORF type:complete len:196 (+),score=26.65 TRINITY_DN2878_c0_g2_i1:589-1176(+)